MTNTNKLIEAAERVAETCKQMWHENNLIHKDTKLLLDAVNASQGESLGKIEHNESTGEPYINWYQGVTIPDGVNIYIAPPQDNASKGEALPKFELPFYADHEIDITRLQRIAKEELPLMAWKDSISITRDELYWLLHQTNKHHRLMRL